MDVEYNKNNKPPLNLYRVGGEILAGEVLGISSACLVLYVLNRTAKQPSIGDAMFGGIAMLVAYSLTTPLGVYLVGNLGDETGSYGETFLGTIMGEAVTMFFMFTTGRWFIEKHETLFYVSSSLFPPIFATIGFNDTRRYNKPSSSETGFINYGGNKFSFSFPGVYYQYSFVDWKNVTQNVNLVKVEF